MSAPVSVSSRGSRLNPLDWNLSQLIPPLGILSALLWGASSITESQLQKQAEQVSKQGIPTRASGILKHGWIRQLAAKAPLFSVIYGLLNSVGAFAQGYSLRGLAFSSFTLFSLLLTPKMWRYNHLGKTILEHPATAATLQKLGKQMKPLARWMQLYNLVAPIGLLTGLFSITKVAQSMPGVTLEHPSGHDLRAFFQEHAPQQGLLDILKRNMGQEWRQFVQTLSHTVQFAQQGWGDLKQAVGNVFHPTPEIADDSVFSRFMQPLSNGVGVPLLYAHATVGRVSASAMAALMFLLGKDLLNKTPAAQKLSSGSLMFMGMNLALLWGQLAGSPAGLFTQFNDWPSSLSAVYRTSGLAYGASAFCAMMKFISLFKKPSSAAAALSAPSVQSSTRFLSRLYQDEKLLGLDEKIWTKVGAFIQGTTYFVNLFIKNLQGEEKNNPSNAQPPASLSPF